MDNIVLRDQKLSKDKYQRIETYNSIHSVKFLINTIAEDNNIIIVKVHMIDRQNLTLTLNLNIEKH